MKIAFIVDGPTEYHCLLNLIHNSGTPHQFIKPFVCDMHPLSNVGQIAYRVIKKLQMIQGKNPDLVVITIDHENREDCPPHFANELRNEIDRRFSDKQYDISVIIKVRTFENWLIADLNGVSSLNKFNISSNIRNKIEPNKADNVNALKLLKQMSGDDYNKVADGKKISERINPQNIAKHSRSFRRLLRIIEVPNFIEQSKNPC